MFQTQIDFRCMIMQSTIFQMKIVFNLRFFLFLFVVSAEITNQCHVSISNNCTFTNNTHKTNQKIQSVRHKSKIFREQQMTSSFLMVGIISFYPDNTLIWFINTIVNSHYVHIHSVYTIIKSRKRKYFKLVFLQYI